MEVVHVLDPDLSAVEDALRVVLAAQLVNHPPLRDRERVRKDWPPHEAVRLRARGEGGLARVDAQRDAAA
eukprot:CAMPEP_0185419982 /NCGR_PEP_ID=MMETSP1365-20130426/9949_1 /TAXON_ID=38817 /ORGANISM="Gephyrocapsa oceanica, Strain RCC1303" /LENGTH=69 /DNA_ID=CAMNT_0028023571 /DNA_START=208 /DNA_END=413 /DNA_ORIENTATION=+